MRDKGHRMERLEGVREQRRMLGKMLVEDQDACIYLVIH